MRLARVPAPRHAKIPVVLLAVVSAALLFVPTANSQDTGAKSDEVPPSPDHVRCRSCDAKGRTKCPRCEGHGKLHKKCERCDGTSRRPCRVCNNPNSPNNSEAGAGHVLCGYCGGNGQLGNTAKRCLKCRGAGSHKCETCRGKGELRCKPIVYAGICSRCRLSGKIVCEFCQGTKWVPRAQDRKESDRDSESGGHKSGEKPPDAAEDTGAEGADSKAKTAAEVERRFSSLTELRLSEGEVDTSGLSKSAAAQGKRAKALDRDLRESFASLPAGADEKLSQTLVALRRRSDETQRRIRQQLSKVSDVEVLLLEFDEHYLRCQRRLANRPSGPFKTGRQKKALENWISDMSYSLNNCEKRAVKLAENPPSMVAETTSALGEELQRLVAAVKIADRSVTKILASGATSSSKAVAIKSSARKTGSSRRSQRDSSKKASRGEETRGDPPPEASARRKTAASHDAGGPRDAGPGEYENGNVEDAEESGSSGLVTGLVCALLGFGAATAVFLTLGRRNDP